jgi:hypothetical protein
VRRDYSPSGLHRLYCAYAVHQDTPSCRSTSRRSVALALAVRLVMRDSFDYAACPGASARRVARHMAHRRLLRLCRASGCLGTSRGSLCHSSSTSTTPRVRVPRHVMRLAVDYFDYAACLGASARRAARHAACRATRCRLLRLHRASGCLGTSRGSLSTSSPTPRVRVPRHVARLVVDCFAYAARPGASARRAVRRAVVDYFNCVTRPGASARHAARRVAHHRLLRLMRLVVDYFAYAARSCASARRVARLAVRRRLLRLRRASGCLSTSRGSLSTTPCAVTSSCGHNGSTSATPCVATTCLVATLTLLRVRHALLRRRLPIASRRPFISTSFPN